MACKALGVWKMEEGKGPTFKDTTLDPGAKGPGPESYTGEPCSSHALAEDHPTGPQPHRDSAGLRRGAHTEPAPPLLCLLCLPTVPEFAPHMPQATFHPVQGSPCTPPLPTVPL